MTAVETLARHPARIAFTRRGARKVHETWARTATPVALRVIAPGDVGPPMPVPGLPDLRVAEGVLWLRLERAGIPVAASELLAFLDRGPIPGMREPWADPLVRHLNRTPLLAAQGGEPQPGDPAPLAPDAPVRLVADGREAASASLREFLDREIRLSGDEVLLRAEPCAHHTSTQWSGPLIELSACLRPEAYFTHGIPLPVPPDRTVNLGPTLRGAIAPAQRAGIAPALPNAAASAAGEALAAIVAATGADPGDGGLRAFANLVPGEALRLHAEMAGAKTAPRQAGLRTPFHDRLESLAIQGAVSTIGPDRYEETFLAATDLLRHMSASTGGRLVTTAHSGLLAHLEHVAGPAARRLSEPEPADSAAIAALSP